MRAFIKDSSFDGIKKKLIIIYILNVIDIMFTRLLLKTGLFGEINIIMQKAVLSATASFWLKIVIPAILVLYVIKRIKNTNQEMLRKANIAFSLLMGMYILIDTSHIVWTACTPLFMYIAKKMI